MHQGYMKRGVSQTILTCALLALAIFLEIGALAVLIVPLRFHLERRLQNERIHKHDF